MAESIILPLANSILKTVASLTGEYATEKIKGLKSVKDDLKVIGDELECIVAVLHDAEAKQYTDAAMKIWLRDLKSLVYDIHDLLDEVATDAKLRTLNKDHFLPRFWYYLSLQPLILRIHFSHKIKDLRIQLEHIVAKKTKFGLTDRPIEAPSVKRDDFDVCGYVNKLAILGRDEAKNDIINRVSGQGNLFVLPIVGMGGIGKTAVAKLVYNDIDQFDIKLWVCVSDKFDLRKILEDVLKDSTRENTSTYSFGVLVERVQYVLKNKKYFLVLDDMWEDDVILWSKLKSILDVGQMGSVILITTRMPKVASITQTIEPYNLDKIPDSVCWCIFRKLAFVEGEEERYPRLVEIGLSIVERCCGIPLVVQCLGSLLRIERDEGEWLRIKDMDNLNKLDGQYDTVKQLLKLSYDKLPSHLKSCFAHLSLFPKDYNYLPFYQSYCWNALGLLEQPDGNYLKHNFFNGLLSRSMLQDTTMRFDNTIFKCKIHDLLHNLAENVLDEELVVLTRDRLSAPDSCRYIAWGLNLADEEFPKQVKAKKARAFIFHFRNKIVSPSFLTGIICNMPYLRILDFGGSQFKELPSSIGSLKHLRFLNLANNGLIKSLPRTICELLNLECLDLEGCERLEELPSEMYKLISLRYLGLTTRQRSLVGTKLNRLPCLQHLVFDSCKEVEYIWDSHIIGCLTSLHSIWIYGCPKLKSLPNSMKLLVGLQYLWIGGCEELDIEKGEEGLNGLLSLESLVISNLPRLSRLPNGIRSAATSLKYLVISDCEAFAELPNWLESFTSLQKLIIQVCPNLLSLPEGIRHLKSLQYLGIYRCPDISRRCAGPDGEDYHLIKHVSEIELDGHRFTPSKE